MVNITEQEFLKLTKKGNLIPVSREIPGDLDTPVSVYYKIAHDCDYSFLLESVEGEEKIARYSFLARDPEMVVRSSGQSISITGLTGKKPSTVTKKIVGSPLNYIREIMAPFKLVKVPGLPRFCGGLIGYLGYDTVRFFENLPNKPKDNEKLPDILLILAKNSIIFDHRNHKIKIVNCVKVKENDTNARKKTAYKKALRGIDVLIKEILAPLKAPLRMRCSTISEKDITSNFSETEFKDIVTRAKKQIRAGEIIQVVLSQRFSVKLKTDPFNIYRMLRTLNPSPYMYYLNFKGIKVVGSSPELLVRCEDGVVETRPIAGTRPRGNNEREDLFYVQDLLNDPKEKAEHIMLVDLGRNDLGRVCEEGSIALSEFMEVEKYSHVMHIVSNVRGKLKKGKDAFDVLQAAFPAGTVSGAPKIRAMEIIDELENISRGPYAGCIGYFSFSGNLDTCITIRTIVVNKDKAAIQAGAGIVADSQPRKEYLETVNKAKAQILAIKKAHNYIN
ncbi:MAG: anthranilate synthase component I [Candidatus Omnitrophica bacterium]|nr:anthranilate synthase component I [Candidatus Omnitrophota bacterium]